MKVHMIGHSYLVHLVWKANTLGLTEAQLLEIEGTVTGTAYSGNSVTSLAETLETLPAEIDVCLTQLGICDLYNDEYTPEQIAFILAEALHRTYKNKPKHFVICLPLQVYKLKNSIKSVRQIRDRIRRYKEMLIELVEDLSYVTIHEHKMKKRWSKTGLHIQTASGWCSYVNSLKEAISRGYSKIVSIAAPVGL